MKFLLTLAIALVLFVGIADARTTGDPLDTNDGPVMATQGDPIDGNDGPHFTVVFLPPNTLIVVPW